MNLVNSPRKALTNASRYFRLHLFKLTGAGILLAFMGFTWASINTKLPAADADNGGLSLPGGFRALVVVDSLKGQGRHIAVNSNGDIYVKARNHNLNGGYGNIALRDTNGDGKVDVVTPFGKYD